MKALILSHGDGRRESPTLVTDEPYRRDQPDEYRLAPHGSLACDWTRKDG
jgi:hypothetical protein